MALDVRDDRVPQVGSAGVGGTLRARYLPIAEHGLIGDLHTVALVGTDGTIDWYCCPRFDSPSVFAAILDADRGGLFRISPDCDGRSSKQLYLPDTNVLITRFLTTSRRRLTGSPARRRLSRCAPSGGWRRSPGPGDSTRRGWPSRRCSPTRTTWVFTRRRSGRPASSSATSRRPSRISR